VGAPQSPYWITPTDLYRDGLLPTDTSLSDGDIANIFGRSIAIIRLDRSSAQSGTIPVAFMTGTPVIVRNAPGLLDDLRPNVDGIVLDHRVTAEGIVAAVEEIAERFDLFSTNARQAYEVRFSIQAGRKKVFEPIARELNIPFS
jgi:glycosyltransferase involved in cell wall biosynthesis